MSPFFIKHPIIAGVISIVTTMLGVICMLALPISQYPDITPVTIQLSATYPGANAQEVADAVATPIELQLSGIQRMDYMSSTSSNNGACSLNVIFEPGTDANTNQQMVVYRAQHGDLQVWVRPLEEFREFIERNGYRGPRFMEVKHGPEG
jgi:HAE1 family hydrophobic/amphiphilic exporter-1